MAVRIQTEDFDIGAEMDRLGNRPQVGALASFVGLVRARGDRDNVAAIELEHYPGMTQRALEAIEAQARQRFDLTDSLIIHRVGRLDLGARIVLVVTASPHRAAALEACAFLIDWLKTGAPFWKREITADGKAAWVASKTSDDDATARWG